MPRPPSIDSCGCEPGHPAHDDSAIRIVYYDETVEVRPAAFLTISAGHIAAEVVGMMRANIAKKHRLALDEVPEEIFWKYDMASTSVRREKNPDKQRPYIAHAQGYFALATPDLHSYEMKNTA